MKNRPLQIGFLGGAINSAVGATHKIALSMDGLWRLSAGCFSRHQDVNHKTASLWKVPRHRVYATWKEMLMRELGRLDAVAIITPTPSHAEMVIAALEHGYAVVCDKALAASAKEAAAIQKTLNKMKGFLAVTYNYSGYPMVRALQNLIRKGALGRLHQIHIEMPQEGFLRLDKKNRKPVPQPWRLVDNEIPTLSLDLGVHIHQMIYFLTGEHPMDVVCTNGNFGLFKGIVDNVLCLANYSSQLHCQIWFGKTALGCSNGLRVRVYGTKGSAQWFQMTPEFISLSDNQGRTTWLERSSVSIDIADEQRYNRFKAGHPAGFIEAFANYYFDVAKSLRDFQEKKKNPSPWVFGVDLAHQGLRMLEAMAKSAKLRSWQKVEGR